MRPLIIANWKMNPRAQKDAKALFDLVKNGLRKIKKVEVVICPPFIYLSNIQHLKSNIQLGSQNCFWKKKGAFTGEISPFMLKNLGCEYVIIGHSERRRYFGETNEMINKKLKLSLAAKLKPIFCVGENQTEKAAGQTQKILQVQIEKGLEKISKKEIKNIVIAYEPVWAIGTGNPCDIEEAQKMGLVIKKIIRQLYGRPVSENMRVLYGGSVDSKNAAFYIKEARLQGLLVGGASLEAKEFVKIVKSVI